jgi:hypothetical protein
MKRTLLRKFSLAIALTIIAMLVGTLSLLAPDAGAAAAPTAGKTADMTPAVDPAVIKDLDKMGAYLRTLKAFQLEAATQREEVLDSGLKVQFAEAITMSARKPNRLLVDVSSDRKERRFFYNGKQFTLWAPRPNLYATVEAPPTIAELVSALQDKFGIDTPLADLFLWDSVAGSKAGITEAADIGPSKIGGANCRHYALRQEGLDWQIWIQQGDFPLPRKLVLTTTTDEARPQFQATYTWNLAPTFDDADFTFDPPADAHKIVLDKTPPEAGKSQKEK